MDSSRRISTLGQHSRGREAIHLFVYRRRNWVDYILLPRHRRCEEIVPQVELHLHLQEEGYLIWNMILHCSCLFCLQNYFTISQQFPTIMLISENVLEFIMPININYESEENLLFSFWFSCFSHQFLSIPISRFNCRIYLVSWRSIYSIEFLMCCLILSSSHCYRILLIWLKPSNTKISLVLRSPVLTTLLSPNRPMTTPILCLSFKFLASPTFFKLDWPTPSFRLLFSHVALSWSVLPIPHFVRPCMSSLIQTQQTLLHSLR